MNTRTMILLAAFFGFTGVGLGAFGTHALSAHFEANPSLEDTFRTGTLYHLIHAVALFGAAWLNTLVPSRWSRLAGVLFSVGIVLFAGSLYLLSVFELRFMGAVAPLGGASFLAGWVSVAIAARKVNA